MHRTLKSAVRPLYHALIRLPLVRQMIVRAAATISTDMNVFASFIEGPFGTEYGLTRRDRARLVASFHRNCRSIESATWADQHTVLAMGLLSIPRDLVGDVIECGTFKGASAASLSLLCRIVGRRLLVCDSFQGLPVEGGGVADGDGRPFQGRFCATLAEVKQHISKYGDIGVCEFVPGFFSESLPYVSRPLVFAFLDVNLLESMKDCLRWIWPLMVEGSAVYSNDALNMDIAQLCFDDRWWQEVLRQPAPGLVGSGCGLPLGPAGSSLGYIRTLRQSDPRWGRRASWLSGVPERAQVGRRARGR